GGAVRAGTATRHSAPINPIGRTANAVPAYRLRFSRSSTGRRTPAGQDRRTLRRFRQRKVHARAPDRRQLPKEWRNGRMGRRRTRLRCLVFRKSRSRRLDMPLVCPETAEQALEIAEKLIASGAIDLLVVDSAAALSPRLELVSGVDAGGGLQSRVLASGLQRLAREARKTQAVVLFLNQTRSRGDDAESSAGGAPLKLHAAARIGLTARGNRVSFRILKNKA